MVLKIAYLILAISNCSLLGIEPPLVLAAETNAIPEVKIYERDIIIF